MFLGTSFYTIDSKGRVAVPHKYRSKLGGENSSRVIITKALRKNYVCLDIYPATEWERVIQKILEDEIKGAQLRDEFMRAYVHPAEDLELDGAGRILVPPVHRETAELKKEVVFTGEYDRFRLWSLEQWNQSKDQSDIDPEIQDQLAKLSV